MWTQVLIPSDDRSHGTQDHSKARPQHRVPHWPTRSEPSGNIAADDPVNRAINRRPHKKPVGHPLPQRREDAEFVQHNVSAVRKHDNGQKSRDDRPHTPSQPPRRLSTTHNWSCCQIRHFHSPFVLCEKNKPRTGALRSRECTRKPPSWRLFTLAKAGRQVLCRGYNVGSLVVDPAT